MRTWGAVKTLLLGLITFGLLPLLAARRNWLQQMEMERHLLDNTLDTLPPATPGIEGLRQSAARLNQQWFAAVVIGLSLIAIIWFFILWLGQETFSFDALLASTYQFHPRRIGVHQPWKQDLFTVWTAGLCAAYLAQWAAVQWHVTRLQRLVKKINPLLQSRARPPIPIPQIGLGVGLRSILGAVVMLLCGALWGVPMMFAAAAQRQYAQRTAPQWGAALPRAFPQILLAAPQSCPNPQCRKPLPPTASFCPRCGQKIS
jgi:hypothetical protein